MAAVRVAVIGAGISGLATAYRIREKAQAWNVDTEVYVLERGNSPGGKVTTVAHDGWIFEGGPAGFLDNEPATLRLVKDLGLGERLLRSNDSARSRYLFRNGRFHELKMSPVGFLTSPLLSVGGRARVVSELFRKQKKDDSEETVGDFGRRRLGEEFTSVMLDSMVSGIHGGDVDRLSVQAAFPKVAALERDFGGLFRGMAALKKQRKKEGGPKVEAGPGGVLHTFRSGMMEPIHALARALGDDVRTGRSVRSIARGGAGYVVELDEGEGGDVHALVLASPAPRMAGMLQELAPAAAQALEQIELAGVHVVCAGYRRDQVSHPLNGFGALIPRSEGVRVLGTIWSSSTFARHAPESHVQLRTMVGGAHDPAANELSDEELIEVVRRETELMYGIRGEPVAGEVFRWNRGIPQYVLGHDARLAKARAALKDDPGVFLTGNSICGVAFNACVAHSETVSDQVVAYLQSLQPQANEAAPA